MNWTWVNRLTVNKRRQGGLAQCGQWFHCRQHARINGHFTTHFLLRLPNCPSPARGNKWHWIYKSPRAGTAAHTQARVRTQKRTPGPPLSGLPGQLLQLNTPHNNLFANSRGAEWRLVFHGHHNRNQVFCHRLSPPPPPPRRGLNVAPRTAAVSHRLKTRLNDSVCL